MSRETWSMMVKVARRKLVHVAQAALPYPAARYRTKRVTPIFLRRTVAEDHFALLLQARY